MAEKDYQLPRVSRMEQLILEMLIAGDELYGLQMIRQCPELKRGTIYVTLNRLEDKGFIKSKEISPRQGEQGPSRRVYLITGDGKHVMNILAVASRMLQAAGVQYA